MKTKILIAIVFLALFAFTKDSFAYGDNLEFEIIAPKEAGTGSPAIPATHRVFFAYPGITYAFKAQVIGGTYPYVFSLDNEPSGMTINNHTGVITWTNPQASASNIEMTVHDKDGHSVSSTWDITVGTTGWYFVDASTGVAEGSQTGAIDAPFNTVADVMAVNDEDGRVYWRSGTYTIPTYHPIYSSWQYGASFDYNDSPHIWIEYPGDAVTMSGQLLECVEIATPYYFEGFLFPDHTEHIWVAASNNDYFTIRNCEVDGLTTSRTTSNDNQGSIFTTNFGQGHYLSIQDSTFHDYHGSAGVGSFYVQNKMLIEGCTFYDQYHTTIYNPDTAIAAKTSLTNITIRKNNIDVAEGSALGTSTNGMFGLDEGNLASENIEICFNRFRSAGVYVHQFNNNSNQGATWYYRNTCQGTWQITWLDATLQSNSATEDNGPFYLDGNVIVNDNADTNANGAYINSSATQHCSHLTYHYNCGADALSNMVIGSTQADLRGFAANAIVNATGNLTESYSAYLGTVGWEIAEDEYWSEGGGDVTAPSTPSGLSVS